VDNKGTANNSLGSVQRDVRVDNVDDSDSVVSSGDVSEVTSVAHLGVRGTVSGSVRVEVS